LQDNPLLIETIEGPSIGQEVDAVLTQLVDAVNRIGEELGPLSVTTLHHEHENDAIQMTSILPPFQTDGLQQSPYRYPPQLNLPEEFFYKELVDHYLFAALYEMFYTSLMAEHYRRVQHLQGAIDRLEQQVDELGKKRNVIRQEEITEEIEVIMLSTGMAEWF
jgi:F-type H+-transporting ATPase subunit gamma